jgi:hypothetical protein
MEMTAKLLVTCLSQGLMMLQGPGYWVVGGAIPDIISYRAPFHMGQGRLQGLVHACGWTRSPVHVLKVKKRRPCGLSSSGRVALRLCRSLFALQLDPKEEGPEIPIHDGGQF